MVQSAPLTRWGWRYSSGSVIAMSGLSGRAYSSTAPTRGVGYRIASASTTMVISFRWISPARADALAMTVAINGRRHQSFAVRRYPASSPMIGTKAAAKRAQLGGFSHRRISSQGRYSTKRGQCRASHISRAQASKLKNRRPPVADTHVWSPNSWPFPSDIAVVFRLRRTARPWQRYDGSQMHRGVRRRERCIGSDPAMPAKLANAYLKRGAAI
jgi:hypothetical protein